MLKSSLIQGYNQTSFIHSLEGRTFSRIWVSDQPLSSVFMARAAWPRLRGQGENDRQRQGQPRCPRQPARTLRVWINRQVTSWSRSVLYGPPADISIKNDRFSASKSLLLVPVWRDVLYSQGRLGVRTRWGQRNTPLRLGESPSWIYLPQTSGRSAWPRQVCPGYSACFPKTRRIMHGLQGRQKTRCH